MSRSGYSDDWCGSQEEQWMQIRWRGAVKSSLRGKRGQAFLKELLSVLDSMPEKSLIPNALKNADGAFCTLGAVANARGIDFTGKLGEDPDEWSDYEWGILAEHFDIAPAMIQEIMWMNDECAGWCKVTENFNKARWGQMRGWVVNQIKTPEVA